MAPAEPNARPFEVQGELPVFAEERKGWSGYIEWERYPEKKKQAAEILAKYDFPVVSNITFSQLTRTDYRAIAA
jgi:sulfite oxidase